MKRPQNKPRADPFNNSENIERTDESRKKSHDLRKGIRLYTPNIKIQTYIFCSKSVKIGETPLLNFFGSEKRLLNSF
jgi:hypothetical protein